MPYQIGKIDFLQSLVLNLIPAIQITIFNDNWRITTAHSIKLSLSSNHI